jgi:hypothetical protein
MYKLDYKYLNEPITKAAANMELQLDVMEIFDLILEALRPNCGMVTVDLQYFGTDYNFTTPRLMIQQRDAKIAYGMARDLLLFFNDVKIEYNIPLKNNDGSDMWYKHNLVITPYKSPKCQIDIYAIESIYEPEEN